MLILLTVCHTFHIFYLSLTDFQNFPGPVALFQDFPVLENATQKKDFPGFPGPIRTLILIYIKIGLVHWAVYNRSSKLSGSIVYPTG